MPSPFPGMDPFLEAPAFFGGVHDSMIIYLREFLQANLPEPYYTDIADRVWVEVARRYIGPDLNVLRPANGAPPSGQGEDGGIATQQIVAEPIVVHVPHDEQREPLLEIFTRGGENERLVTTVEVLSPANRGPAEHGRDLYLRKQREVLNGRVNLVEIDLLRGGEHTTAVPLDFAQARAGTFDYHICVHRFDNLEDYFVYPILLAQRLPVFAIPLLPGEGAVSADLQAVFDRCYDTGPYRRRVRYAEPMPGLPLSPSQAQWAIQVLRDKGLLPPETSTGSAAVAPM